MGVLLINEKGLFPRSCRWYATVLGKSLAAVPRCLKLAWCLQWCGSEKAAATVTSINRNVRKKIWVYRRFVGLLFVWQQEGFISKVILLFRPISNLRERLNEAKDSKSWSRIKCVGMGAVVLFGFSFFWGLMGWCINCVYIVLLVTYITELTHCFWCTEFSF